ncbi:MAG: hypothetical protein ACTTKH_07820, partial [Treponema sp.]
LNACFIKRYEKYPIFQYFEKGKDGEYERKNLPQMFHIFDHTARGLNAVYNVLLETYNIMQNGEEDKKFTQTKILLETIVGSNSLFNQYRKQIFENIIKFGVDFEDTRIECENFRSFIAKEFSKNNLDSSKTKSKIKDEKKVINLQDILFNQAVKIFGFFVLLDFSIRVLEKNEVLNDKTYLELKRDNIINLINIPAISESMAISENIVKGSEKGGIVLIKDLENKESKIMSNIILGFLSDMDFGYALTLFHFLYKNGNNYIFEKIAVNTTDLEWIYKKCLILYDMVKSISWLKYVEQESNWQAEIKNILTYLILEFEGKFRELLGILKGGKELSQLLKILLNELLDKMKFNGNVFSTDKGNENYKEEYKTVFLNTLAENLENKIFNDKNLISLAEKRSEYEKLLVKRPFMKERILIINAVDKYHLWEDEFSSNVKKYIKNILIDCLGRIQCDELDRVDISCFKTKWDKFKNSKMGSSETLAKKLERYISGLLGKEENYKIQFRTFIELLDEISKLAYSKARYGREAAFEMLKEVQNVKLINLFEHEYEEEVKEFMDIFYAFIHMYASYIFDDNKNIYLLSKEIAEFKNIIYDSSIDGIGNQIKTFNDLLANEVGEEVLSKLEELFPA